MNNYKEVLYDIPNNKGTEIDKKYFELFNSNRDGIKDYLDNIGAKKDYFKDYFILFLVSYYTFNTKESPMYFDAIKRELLYLYKDVKIRYNDRVLKVDTDDYSLTTNKITDLIPNINSLMDGVDLNNESRIGHCHIEAFDLSKNLNMPNRLVTSYIYGTTDLSKFLHSFVEVNINGKEYVIDCTINSIMNKEAFYKIHHIEKEDIISIIDNKTLKDDLNKYYDLLNKSIINERDYEIFREEFINEFKKKEDKLL